MSFELSEQAAVVTGAARGIGLGIAHRLAELGVRSPVTYDDYLEGYRSGLGLAADAEDD